MFRSDANIKLNDDIILDIDLITLDIIPYIEKEIDPCDLISIVFLLYDTPDTALQRLTIYQRISRDLSSDSNLLLEWARHAQSQSTWKKKLLEALYTCQLYSIIRKIGLHVNAVKKHYITTNETLLNPMKKTLYKLCEAMKIEDLHKLKKTLITYEIDTTDYETCELIILHLMCQKFISINMNNGKFDISIENLATILDNFSELQGFSNEMRKIEFSYNNINNPIKTKQTIIDPPQPLIADEKSLKEKECYKDIKDIFEMLDDLKLEDIPEDNFKSDTITLGNDAYPILNPKALGICLIINQEKFYPSKQSIESIGQAILLENRHGSTKDKINLSETMKKLNFEVVSHDNLNHIEMLNCIKSVLRTKVSKEHSMFMLCILSHGTKGNVYAADSVKIKVEDIESLLDSDDVVHLRNKPKIMILQACQTNDDQPSYSPLVADSPKSSFKYYIKKSDILIYWATAPSYEAYRHVTMGSIFIQMLCAAIKKYAKKEHLNDLFTKVNYVVRKMCVTLKRDQLPKVEHTLIKKLYLQIPEK
nr:caspase-8 [Chilo suppressalis]